ECVIERPAWVRSSALGRPRLIGLLVGASALIALAAPGRALAGTFSWTLPNDFTTTAPGSNPEHKYGAVSWTYQVDGAPFPSADFSTSACGGTGYTDGADCISDTGSAVALQSTHPLTGSPHQVTIRWTNPFPTSQRVSISSTLTAALTC